jgi:hypothetical protein
LQKDWMASATTRSYDMPVDVAFARLLKIGRQLDRLSELSRCQKHTHQWLRLTADLCDEFPELKPFCRTGRQRTACPIGIFRDVPLGPLPRADVVDFFGSRVLVVLLKRPDHFQMIVID